MEEYGFKGNIETVRGLEPENVWKYFAEISSVPRGSGNEEKISEYFENFAKSHNFWYKRDKSNNILIRKEASQGYENAPGVILQGHMDMVCEKLPESKHDFLKDPVKLLKDGDFIMAYGTTLGGDDGIAAAMALAVLDDDTLCHPMVEVLLTTDEEVGMNGARNFDCSLLKGRRLINIDSEEEGEIIVSCAGGMRIEISLPVERQKAPEGCVFKTISVNGLKGGHSGSDIHLQRASAIKLLGRVLKGIEDVCGLCDIFGGSKDNAIPREASAIIFIKPENEVKIKEILSSFEKTFADEYSKEEYGISVKLSDFSGAPEFVMSESTFNKAVDMLNIMPYGVMTMSSKMPGLVESSVNIGVLRSFEDKITVVSAPRSSVISRRDVIEEQFKAISRILGAQIELRGKYPAWEYKDNSPLRDVMVETFKDLFNCEPKVNAIHAGLECGLFAGVLPEMDMASIGPDMSGVHTTEEKLSIPSVERIYRYLTEILKRLK